MRVAQRFWKGGRKASSCTIILWSRADYTTVHHKSRVQPLQGTLRCSKFRSRLYIFHSIWPAHGEQCIRVTRCSLTVSTSHSNLRRRDETPVLQPAPFRNFSRTISNGRHSEAAGHRTPRARRHQHGVRVLGYFKRQGSYKKARLRARDPRRQT